jgi:ATP-dependent protease ClpP protease subunit
MHVKSRRASQPGKPFFKAALQSDGTLELMVYEEIGTDFWSGQGVGVKEFKQQIDQAGNFQRILIRINSPGGDAFEGIAIYSLIRAQKKPVEVCVDGIAASAASIIAMAGDTITMGPNTMMMIHEAEGGCLGRAEDMRKMADALEKVSTAIGQTYVRRTGKPVDEIAAMMNAETWMNADQCLAEGFCTAITSEPDQAVEERALNMARRFAGLARMKHLPDALRNDDLDNENECACDCQNCQDDDHDECTNPDCDDPNCEDCPMQADAQAQAGMPVSIEDARAVLEEMEANAEGAVTIESARAVVEEIESVLSAPENGSAPDPNYAAYIAAGSRSNAGRW